MTRDTIRPAGPRPAHKYPVLHAASIGLCPPDVVADATKSYLESEDILREWIDECCVRAANAWTGSTDLFNSWKPWAEQRDEWVGSEKTFSSKL